MIPTVSSYFIPPLLQAAKKKSPAKKKKTPAKRKKSPSPKKPSPAKKSPAKKSPAKKRKSPKKSPAKRAKSPTPKKKTPAKRKPAAKKTAQSPVVKFAKENPGPTVVCVLIMAYLVWMTCSDQLKQQFPALRQF